MSSFLFFTLEFFFYFIHISAEFHVIESTCLLSCLFSLLFSGVELSYGYDRPTEASYRGKGMISFSSSSSFLPLLLFFVRLFFVPEYD